MILLVEESKMVIENSIIGLALAILSLTGFAVAVKQGLGWIPKLGILERIIKSTLTTLGFIVFAVSGFVSIDYLSSPNVEKTWSLVSIEGLLCFAIPMGLITFVGSFIWFLRRDATHQYFSNKMSEIVRHSKRPDNE